MAESVLERLRTGLTIRRESRPIIEYAKDIGVSPQRLFDIMLSTDNELKSVIERAAKSGKAKSGLSESLTRVFAHLVKAGTDLSIDDLFKAFELNPDDASVRRGRERVQSATPRTDKRVTGGDPTLERIFSGSRGRQANVVKVGILDWPPYASKAAGGIENSFAGRFMTRLIGSLQPVAWTVDPVWMDFAEVLTPEPLVAGEVDAVLGIYDTAARRLAGFRCLHLPGLGGAMGAIVISDRPLKWMDILDPTQAPSLVAYVVDGDAAHLLLRGACGYVGARVVAIDPREPELAKHIAGQLYSRLSSQFNTPNLAPKSFTFVADASMVDEVLLSLETLTLNLPQGSKDRVKRLPTDGPDVPRYPVGIATSDDSDRWYQLLEQALHREILVNTAALTAQSYAELLSVPSSITALPLDRDLPEAASKSFAIRVGKKLVEFWSAHVDRRPRIERVLREILDQWEPLSVEDLDAPAELAKVLKLSAPASAEEGNGNEA